MQVRLSNGEIVEATAMLDSSGNIVNTSGGSSPQSIIIKPATSGGGNPMLIKSLASTNLSVLKASPGQVYGVQMSNSVASWAFVKLYNKATNPVLASDVPKMVIGIPPGGRCEVNRAAGVEFTVGIAIAITAIAADTDTTAVALNQIVGDINIF